MNSIHHNHRSSKRYPIADLRYACHGQAVPLVRISGLTTAEYSTIEMSIKIVINHWDQDDNTGDFYISDTKELLVDNLSCNLMECINMIATGENIICFDDYYRVSYTDIIYEKRFPYILKGDKYEWHVPIEDVSVGEFVDTHILAEERVIKLREGGIAGGDLTIDLSAIVEWIPFMLNYVGYIFSIKEISKIIIPIYRKLIGRDKKAASPYEFLELLQARESWTLKELQNRTSLDTTVIECMLIQAGFEKQGDIYINNHTRTYEEEQASYNEVEITEKKLWGEYGHENEIDNLKYALHETNRCLTGLEILSDIYNSDYFDFMMKLIDYHIDSWNEYIYKGKDLQFIKLKKTVRYISDGELDRLTYSTERLCEYVAYLSEIIEMSK